MLFLAPIFCDNAILQAEKPVRIFGEADASVTITLGTDTCVTTVTDGRWLAELPPHPYGDVCELTVCCADTVITITDVTFGDVYLFAGQSNMEFKLHEATADGALLVSPHIRLYATEKYLHNDPYSPADGWVSLNEQSAPNVSAVAYYTVRELYRRRPRPIGIISAHQGASVIETWIGRQAHAQLNLHLPPEALSGDHFFPRYAQWNQNALLYDLDIRPILPYALAGVIFYQGESNFGEGESHVYDRYLTKLVCSWRVDFMDEALPFVIVQIADYIHRDTPAWHRIQTAQAAVCDALPYCYLVISRDVCETDNIHPPTKHKLAARIAARLSEYTKGVHI